MISIKIDSEKIIRVSETKFLGLVIDEHLTWKPQIKHISSKVSRNIGIINKIKHNLPKHALKTLYYSMIYPYLYYGNIVRASTYKTNINRLQILQKMAIRIITNSDYLSHTSKLFEREKILTINQINIFEISLLMFKYYNNQFPESFEGLFRLNQEIHHHNTRQSKYSHVKSRPSRLGQFSISYTGPTTWNKYNLFNIKSKPTNHFKIQMKNILLQLDGSTY